MKDPIDSRQLRVFSVLARTASFTKAGKELFLSQSAVSHSMKALGEDVGCLLLGRMGKKVSLTQAGKHLLIRCDRVLNEMNAARISLKHLGKWGHGRLRIGASTTACQHILPAVLRKFKVRFPCYEISIIPGDSSEALEELRRYKVDLALTLELKGEEMLKFHPLFLDELIFLTNPTHPWAESGRRFPDSNIYFSNDRGLFCGGGKVTLDTVFELGSMEAIKELAKLGLGGSIIAPWIAQKELLERSLVALPIGRRKLRRHWVFLHWKNKRLNLAEESFVGLC
jgi:DNA-binding transcriptional LysR family regulator